MARAADPVRKVQVGDGIRWEVVKDTAPAGAPRQQRRRRFRTQREAKAWLAEVTDATNKGTWTPPTKLTLGAHLDAWLAGKRDLKPSTRRGYLDALKPVRAALGGRPLQSLVKADVDGVVNARLALGRSPRTVALMLVVFQQALDSAMREGMLVRNVVALVERPTQPHREMASWSPEQAQRFSGHVATDRLHAAWALVMRGLRRGEVVGLRWADVDLNARTLAVTQARVSVAGEVFTGSPKSPRSRRTLPLDDGLAASLRAWRSEQAQERLAAGAAYDDHGLVVQDALGRPVRPEWFSDQFTRLASAASVPVIRLHDARHTSVSLMLRAGAPVHIVAAWHGHDPRMTLAVYGHAKPDDLLAMAQQHGATLSAAPVVTAM